MSVTPGSPSISVHGRCKPNDDRTLIGFLHCLKVIQLAEPAASAHGDINAPQFASSLIDQNAHAPFRVMVNDAFETEQEEL